MYGSKRMILASFYYYIPVAEQLVFGFPLGIDHILSVRDGWLILKAVPLLHYRVSQEGHIVDIRVCS